LLRRRLGSFMVSLYGSTREEAESSRIKLPSGALGQDYGGPSDNPSSTKSEACGLK
jgi:hypothetical protein